MRGERGLHTVLQELKAKIKAHLATTSHQCVQPHFVMNHRRVLNFVHSEMSHVEAE